MGARKLLVELAFCVCLSSAGFCGTYGGGAGTETNPYIISTDAHLQEFAASDDWGMCFKLTADVDASLYTPPTFFTGVFDGNGYSVTGFNYTSDGGFYGGFFCRVEGAGAVVKNLTIIAPNINVFAKEYVGTITGRLRYGAVVSGCTVVGGTVRGYNYTGGVAGYNFGGSITGCTSSASVTGNARVGGIVGANDLNSYVTGCIAEGNVAASSDLCGGVIGENLGTVTASCSLGNVSGINYAGGLAGANGQSGAAGTIVRSFAVSQTSGTSHVGGLVGRNVSGSVSDSYAMGAVLLTNAPAGGLIGKNESSGSVARCYSTGYVNKTNSNIGGLVGQNAAGGSAITASFWDTESSYQTNSAGGEGKTTYYMQQAATYTAAGWDFLGETINGTADKWRLCQDGIYYPGLSWEWSKADLVCPDGVEFVDFAVLAGSWMQSGAGLKGDLDGSGSVDVTDLAIFVQYWLTGLDSGLPT